MNKVTKNILYNFTGNIGSKVLSFLIVAITTRMFGSAIFGQFNVATAEYSYFSLFAIMGMNGYGLFLLAKEENAQKRQEIISDVCSVKTLSGIFFAGILLVYSLLLPNSHRFVAPFALLLIFQATDLSWALQALQDMKLTAYGSLITIVVNAGMLAVCYFAGIYSVYALIFANIFSTLVLQILYVTYIKKKHGFSLSFHIPRYFYYVKKALPYMVSGLFAGINTNIDMVIMGYILSPQEVGYYSAGFKLVSEFVALCAVVFTPLFPMFIEKIASGEIAHMNRITGFLRTILLSVIIPCAMVGVVYGKELLSLLFGAEYEAGYAAFAVLMIFVSLLYYREIYGYTLTAAGKQTIYLRVVAVSAAFNIVTNLILIPQYGIVAAAGTTLVSEVINLIGMRYYVRKLLGIRLDKDNAAKLTLPLTILLALLLLGRYFSMPYILVIAVACVVYAAAILLFGVIKMDYLKKLISKN